MLNKNNNNQSTTIKLDIWDDSDLTVSEEGSYKTVHNSDVSPVQSKSVLATNKGQVKRRDGSKLYKSEKINLSQAPQCFDNYQSMRNIEKSPLAFRIKAKN